MIADVWTKSGTHYRADDVAQTVECVGPEPFPPHKIVLAIPAIPEIGRRMRVMWADGGPFGKASMSTSDVVRVELSGGPEAAREVECGDDCGVHAPGCDGYCDHFEHQNMCLVFTDAK